MPILREYLRPATLADAMHLLELHRESAALLAGGTDLVGALESRARPDIEVVIDLGGLRLSGIHATPTHLVLGAMATLTDVLEDEAATALANGLLRRAARNEGALNYRNAATVGGVVAGASTESEFYAALLALGASISTTAHDAPLPLATMTKVEGIITAIHVPMENARSGMARVARTPADRPIVAAIAVVSGDTTRVALCGVADRPILAGVEAPPFADFRGSAEYRQAMAEILRERALAEAKAA